MVGSKLLNFNNTNSIVVQSLPQPTVPPGSEERAYSGQIPKLSQFAEYDQNGALLFFCVDGNIYDKEGYLMIKKGVTGFTPYPNYPTQIMDFLPIKIPGHCDKYFLAYGQVDGVIGFSILDLNLPNAYWQSDRKGGVVDLQPYGIYLQNEDEAGAQSVYEINFYDFLSQNENIGSPIYDSDGIVINGHSVIFSLETFSSSNPGAYGVRTDMILVDNNQGGDKKLIFSKEAYSFLSRVQGNGIFIDPTVECMGFANDYPRATDKCAASFYNNSYYLIYPVDEVVSLNVQSFNSTWVNSECLTDGNPLPGSAGNPVSSAEKSGNGQYFYIINTVAPHFKYLNLNNLNAGYQNWSTMNAVTGIEEYFDCVMALNFYEGVPSLYLFDDSGIAVIKNIDNPANAVFVVNPFPGLSAPALDMTSIAGSNWELDYTIFDAPRVVQSRTYYPTQQQELQNASCCQNYADIAGYNGHTVNAGAATWTYGVSNNPWNATGPVYMSGDLIFNAGSNITINGMEFRFGPDADVIINIGAFVKLNSGSKWTSYECDGLMWPGVDLMGTGGANQNITDGTWTPQGILHINTSTIENARIGVEVGTLAPSTGGGVLKGYTAKFRNCEMGVRYQKYQLLQYGHWYTSTWIVDAHLKDPALKPLSMVNMREMKFNISFTFCSFIHDTPNSVYAMVDRGTAIIANNSQFSLSGNNGSYDSPGDNSHTTFYKWRKGISATNGGTTSFSVNKLRFQQCNIGITAQSVNNESITENIFIIPSLADWWPEKPRGVVLNACTGYTFRENDFEGVSADAATNNTAQNVGAMIINSGGAVNLGYRNDFKKLWKGAEVQQNNRNGDGQTGLQLRCNKYENIKYDQYLASNAQWRDNQGDPNQITTLANNYFSVQTNNCQNLRYDMYVHPTHQSWWEFYYIRPNNDWYNPDSHEPFDGANCTSPFMEDFFPGQYVNITSPVYADICPLMPQTVDIGEGIIEQGNAISNLENARALFTIVVDNNQKVDIEAEINNAFPLVSDLMRNYLLARSPLSDEIMKRAIDKYGLLDSWHLTQVLLANSPITKDVLVHLESTGALNEFFMSFLYDAQITGAANYRRLLEYEIAARESERHNALTAIIDYYNTHADQLDIAETLKPIMLADGSIEAKTWLLDYYIAAGDELSARTLLEEIGLWKGMADYALLKKMQLDLMNDWSGATASQISDLEAWVANPTSSGSGPALAVLHSLGLSDLEVEPEVPEEDRAYFASDSEKKLYQRPEMSAYPNPASGLTYISYPADADGIGNLVIYDQLGQQVFNSVLNTQGIYELDSKFMASGVYLLQILVEGKTIAESKLVVLE